MEKNSNLLLVALVVLVLGFAGGYLVRGNQQYGWGNMYSMMGGYPSGMGSMMYGNYYGNNEDFDQQFLAQMIMHHEGAVVMSQAALKNAKHEEIKQLAQKIIQTQTAEIQQMQEWQQQWFGTQN